MIKKSSVRIWLTESAALLKQAGSTSPRLDAEVLLAHVLGTDRGWLVAHSEELLTEAMAKKAQALLGRRINREPIAYLIGAKEFYGREFFVTPDTLIPRPETEDLVELVHQALHDIEKRVARGGAAPTEAKSVDFAEDGADRATGPASSDLRSEAYDGSEPNRAIQLLDVGTGSGCIGVTLKLEHPELNVTLTDISDKALAVANTNAERLDAKVDYQQSDLLAAFSKNQKLRTKNFDIIVANLPYVNPEWKRSPETNHEPALALFAENNGCALIYKLIEQAPSVLAANGLLVLEADPEQHKTIVKKSQQHGFIHQETRGYGVALRLSTTDR